MEIRNYTIFVANMAYLILNEIIKVAEVKILRCICSLFNIVLTLEFYVVLATYSELC